MELAHQKVDEKNGLSKVSFFLNLGAPETRCDNGANDGVTIGDLVDEDNDSWQAPAVTLVEQQKIYGIAAEYTACGGGDNDVNDTQSVSQHRWNVWG